jgi:DEAD/DEAH box helicase domain-containing protein
MDTLVLDIETKNTFAEVGGKGKEFLDKLNMSVVCIYSYNKNEYFCFDEHQLDELKAFLSTPALLVGFSSNKFDLPILNRILNMDLKSYPRLDLSDEIELRTGRLIGLNALAQANLGKGKTHENVAAPVLYREGKIDELKEYCKNDVMITKEIYDKAKKNGFLLIPDKQKELLTKVEIQFSPDAQFYFLDK